MAEISILPYEIISAGKHNIANKQDKLVSGENIKTINNQSILGSGNIEVQSKQEGGNFFKNITPLSDGSGLVFTLLDGSEYILNRFDATILDSHQYIIKNYNNVIKYSVIGSDDVDVIIMDYARCHASIDRNNKEFHINPYDNDFTFSAMFINNRTGEVKIKKLHTNTAYTVTMPSTLRILPTGESVTCTISTNLPNYYTVVEGSWFKYDGTNPERLVFEAEPNTSGTTRVAKIFLKDDFGNTILETSISQASYIEAVIGKEFTESYSKSSTTMSGTLTFDMNPNYSPIYTVTICGCKLSADIEGNSLVVYDGSYPRNFTFSDDYNTITGPDQFDLSVANIYSIRNYIAKIKTEEEEDTGDAIAGTWNATYYSTDNLYSNSGTWTSNTGTIKIEGSSGNYTITEFLGRYVSWPLTMSGNNLSYNKDGLDLALTYDASTGKLTSPNEKVMTDYISFRIKSIVATK